MKRFDTILFDLDGTLIDTNEIIVKSYQHAFKTHLPDLVISEEEIIAQIGPTLQAIFSRYTKSPFLVQELIQTYRVFYTENEHAYFSLYEGVHETLLALKDAGINLGIVTSKFKEAAWPSFTHYQLDKYFDTFIALDDVKDPKPNAEPVLKALSHFPGYKQAVMIGDNQGDILAGKNAGIKGAGVAWSIKGETHLNEVNPDIMFTRMQDILNYI